MKHLAENIHISYSQRTVLSNHLFFAFYLRRLVNIEREKYKRERERGSVSKRDPLIHIADIYRACRYRYILVNKNRGRRNSTPETNHSFALSAPPNRHELTFGRDSFPTDGNISLATSWLVDRFTSL